MRIREVSYRRVRNLGNYETETVEMIAEVNEEDPMDVFVELKNEVCKCLELKERIERGDIDE